MSQHPIGRYKATVLRAEVGESPKAGTPGVFFTFKTSEGEIDGTLWLSDAAYERTLRTLRECFGFDDDFNSLADQVEGREGSITVEMEPSQDGTKEYPRVKWLNPIRQSAKPAPTTLLTRLSAQAKRIAKPADMPPPKPVLAPTSEDVPF